MSGEIRFQKQQQKKNANWRKLRARAGRRKLSVAGSERDDLGWQGAQGMLEEVAFRERTEAARVCV